MNKSEVTSPDRPAKLWWSLVLVFSIIITAATITAQTREPQRAEFHETYKLNPGGTVSVSNVSGHIHVTGGDENQVSVDAVKRSSRKDEDLDKVEIQVAASAERVEVRTIYPRSWGPGKNIPVDYEIRVPRSAIINALSSVSGDITLSNIGAKAVARTTSGAISAQNLGSDANLATTSGHVTASDIKGALVIRSVSGNLQINNIGAHLTAQNVSGSLRATEIRDDAEVSSTSGSVRIERVGGRVGARSVSGAVSVFDVSGDVEASSTSDHVTVEKVRGRVTASSISGRVIARSVGEGVRANTVNGAIEITSVKGGIGADTTSGTVTLRDVESEEVRVSSHSGSVRFQGKVSRTGRYIFNSFSGEVIVTLPADTEFNVLAKTFSGDIETDFPVEVGVGSNLSSRNRRLQATHGKGGAQLNLTGFSASLRIKKQ